jgi:hypothetical protein
MAYCPLPLFRAVSRMLLVRLCDDNIKEQTVKNAAPPEFSGADLISLHKDSERQCKTPGQRNNTTTSKYPLNILISRLAQPHNVSWQPHCIVS